MFTRPGNFQIVGLKGRGMLVLSNDLTTIAPKRISES